MTERAASEAAPATPLRAAPAPADRPARAELTALNDLYDLVDAFKGEFARHIRQVSGSRARARVRVAAESYATEALKGLLDAPAPDAPEE